MSEDCIFFSPYNNNKIKFKLGAGKSTLLDILAGRNKQGTVSGTILINGKPRNNSFKRISG